MPIVPPEQFYVLAGASGAGKTMLLLEAWKEHEEGRHKFPICFDPAIKSAGIIVADRTAEETMGRCKDLNIKHLEVYGIVDDLTLNTELIRTNKTVLWNTVISRLRSDPPLIFIDPMGLFMKGKLIDYNNVAATLIEFNRYAKQNHKTILGVHHTTKARKETGFLRVQDRASGSGAISGFSSTQYVLVQGLEADEAYDTLSIIHHTSKQQTIKLGRREDGYFDVLGQYAKEKIMEIFSSLNPKVMKLEDVKLLAMKYGMEPLETQQWLYSHPNFNIQGVYVLYQ